MDPSSLARHARLDVLREQADQMRLDHEARRRDRVIRQLASDQLIEEHRARFEELLADAAVQLDEAVEVHKRERAAEEAKRASGRERTSRPRT